MKFRMRKFKYAIFREGSRSIWLALCFSAFCQLLNAQVRGVVSTESGPAAGVTVVAKGTNNGTTTDVQGRYELRNVATDATLVFSYTGYDTQEVPVNNRSTVDVELTIGENSLDQLVVVGYGTQRAKDLTGAVGVLSEKDRGKQLVTNNAQLIQGKQAGVQIVTNDGIPGSRSRIIIRGTGSFTSTEPVYVLDGLIIGGGEFNQINPMDIEDITILKDASSVAIFGAQGANGVVLITTKRAKSGKPRVTYNGTTGVSQPWRQLSIMNAAQYVDLVRDIQGSLGAAVTPKINSPEALIDRTDWQGEIFRTGTVMTHSLGVSGGTDQVTYKISAGYNDQDAILGNYNFKRGNIRVALEEKFWNSKLRFGQTAYLTFEQNSGVTPSFGDALRMPTYAPILDPSNLGGYSKVTTTVDLNDAFNPLTGINLTSRRSHGQTMLGQFYGEVELLKGLRFRSQFNITYGSGQGNRFTRANQNGNLTFASEAEENYYFYWSPVLDNLLYYDKEIGNHRIGLMVGQNWQSGGRFRNVNLRGSNFINDNIKQVGVAGTQNISSAGAGQGAPSYAYFGRANYSFKDKYLLNASIRRDAVAVFLGDNRFAVFPSFGAGWRISEEDFFQGGNFLSNLKLRASWGQSGNARSGLFATSANVFTGGQNNTGYTFGDSKTFVGGATINALPNPNLRWEETTQTDVGLDIGLWNNSVNIALDWYNRFNDDLIVNVPIPPSTGAGVVNFAPQAIPTNVAAARNRGIEATIGMDRRMGDFFFGINVNFAYNQNVVVRLDKDSLPIIGGNFADVVAMTRTVVGQPIGSFYGYRTAGIASTTAQVTALNSGTPRKSDGTRDLYQKDFKVGDRIFQDLDGDGIITEKDQTFLGNPIPRFQYGGNITAGYKGLDLFISLQGVAGLEVINALKYTTEGATRPFNSSTALLNRWKAEGDAAEFPRAGQNADGSKNLRGSDYYVESGAFLRFRTITLGYNLPKIKNISNVHVYLTGQNLITVSNYTGYDPEVSTQFPDDDRLLIFERGIDFGQYPQPRSIIFGVDVSF